MLPEDVVPSDWPPTPTNTRSRSRSRTRSRTRSKRKSKSGRRSSGRKAGRRRRRRARWRFHMFGGGAPKCTESLRDLIWPISRPHRFDNLVDRLHHTFTSRMLMILGLSVSAYQAFYGAIYCWIPAHFKDPWSEYVETTCYYQNTYRVETNAEIPQSIADKEATSVTYYRWIPFVLFLQAMFFNMPHIMRTFVKIVSTRWLTDLEELLDFAYKTSAVNMTAQVHKLKTAKGKKDSMPEFKSFEDRDRAIVELANLMSNKLHLTGDARATGYKLSVTCGLLKLYQIVNIALQFYLLSICFGHMSFLQWGKEMLNDWWHRRPSEENAVFPMVVMCDVPVREWFDTNRHTVQCVLPTNALYQHVFVVIWVWLVILGVSSVLNVLFAFLELASPCYRSRSVRAWLCGAKGIAVNERLLEQFVKTLTADAILVLHAIDREAGYRMARTICKVFYSNYHNKKHVNWLDEVVEDSSDLALPLLIKESRIYRRGISRFNRVPTDI